MGSCRRAKSGRRSYPPPKRGRHFMRTIRLHPGFPPRNAYWQFRPPFRICPCIRYISTKPPTEPSPQSVPSNSPGRFDKVLSRTPKFLRSWIQPIANKPLSHITSFLILHEVLTPPIALIADYSRGTTRGSDVYLP